MNSVREENSKKEIFETLPVRSAIATMAIPTIISQLINLAYNMVDTFFIGRTGNSYMAAAVAVTFTIFMLTIAFANLFGIGGGSLIARLIGKGRENDARKVSAFSFYCGIGAALFYSLVNLLFMDEILMLFGASKYTIAFARHYVWMAVVLGSVPIIGSGVSAHILRNVGYSKQASIGLSGGGLLNMILDPLFMFVILPDGMQVLGAALATMLANLASFIYMIIMLSRVSKKAAISIDPRSIKGIKKEVVREMFYVGVPSALLTAFVDVANIVTNALMAAYGDQSVAAIGIVMKAERLPNAINIGICQGMMPIVAYNYAAGNRQRMKDVISAARTYGLVISVACVVLFEIFAGPIMHIFMSTSAGNAEEALATIAFGTLFLRIRCIGAPLQFMNFHTSYCLQSMGDGRDTLIHAVARDLVFYVPVMFLLNVLLKAPGIVAARIVGEGLGAIFVMILLRRFMRRIDK